MKKKFYIYRFHIRDERERGGERSEDFVYHIMGQNFWLYLS